MIRRERDRVEYALIGSEKRFKLLIDRASVGINIGDAAGALTYINRALLDLLEYTEADVAEGRVRWNELTPPRYEEVDRRALQQVETHGFASPYEKIYTSRTGRMIPVQVGAVLIPHWTAIQGRKTSRSSLQT